VIYFASTKGNTLIHDRKFSCQREVASSNVNGVFLADGTAKGLGCFCIHHEKPFESSTQWVPDWEFFGTGHKYQASCTLNELRREHGGENQSTDLKTVSGNSQQVAGDWRGRGF
jgi:hypothetical protein